MKAEFSRRLAKVMGVVRKEESVEQSEKLLNDFTFYDSIEELPESLKILFLELEERSVIGNKQQQD